MEVDEGVLGELLVEMNGCKVCYGNKIVFGNWDGGLYWIVWRG